MENIIAFTAITVVGLLFLAMAVAPMLMAAESRPARHRRHLVLVHSSAKAGATTDHHHAA
jgi:hypothetical protein